MAVLDNLEPKAVFHFFEELCSIPHGTFDTKRISDYCVRFAEERGLEVVQDEANNVIIRKNGTEGYETSEPVIIQGHLDMVCEKTEDSDHDFKKDGLDLYIEDGFVKAKKHFPGRRRRDRYRHGSGYSGQQGHSSSASGSSVYHR